MGNDSINNGDRGLRPLNSGLQKIAIEELNEVPERVNDDIQALREWVQKQPHLKSRTSDQFLVAFLRGCKFSIEKAKKKLDKFYTLRHTLPEIYLNRSVDSKIMEIIKTGVALRLPKPEGYAGPVISIIRVAAYDLNKYSFPEIIKTGTIIGDIQFMEEDNCTISGLVEIMDMTDVTVNHLFHLNPAFLKRCSHYSDEGMPLRHKGIHFICTIPQFDSAYSTLKSLMGNKEIEKSKFMEMIWKCLPKEYGGTNGTVDEIIDFWTKKVQEYEDFFEEEKQYGSDEKLRTDDQPNLDSIYGCDGSFRMLSDVD
uniref:CRAL/TRIO N-terminal domain-containing protein n=1 Tax=Megaselia scalaris TaxID=36166 RepID=T1GDS8_MEGSC